MNLLLSFLLLLTGAQGVSPTRTAVRVELGPEAQVTGVEFGLGHVARVHAADAETAERLRAVSLGWAPAPGFSRLVQRWQVAQAIERDLPGLAVRVEGAASCRVVPRTERIPGASLAAEAESALRALLRGWDATIAPGGATHDLEVPAAIGRRELRAVLREREPRAGAWSVPVEVWIDGAPYQTAWVPFQVDVTTLAPVLVRDVRRGDALDPSWVELRRVSLREGSFTNALEPGALLGAVALRGLVSGSTIASGDVRRDPVVRRGQLVQLEVVKGAVSAQTLATALSDGAIGDRLRVQTGAGARELVARVVARDRVRLELPDTNGTQERGR